MSRQISFEVYAFDGARWSLQQNFGGSQREQALDAAHRIYGQSHIKGVRVIQETLDTDTGEASEKSLLSRTKSDDVPKNLNKEIKVAAKQAAPSGGGKSKADQEKKPKAVISKPVPGAPVPPEPVAKPVASVVVPQHTDLTDYVYLRAIATRFAGAVAGGGGAPAGGERLPAPRGHHLPGAGGAPGAGWAHCAGRAVRRECQRN